MSAIKTIFKAIDVLFDSTQNNRPDTRDPDGKIVIETDLIYDETYPKDCLLDLYHIPRTDGKKNNVMLYIHGGGWEAGDKKYRSGISKWFAIHGWYVVNINYALAPEHKYPVPMQNVVTAYNWIVENAEKYNFNLDNFIVSGDSAGAYYAAMIGALDHSPALQEKLGCKPNHPVQGLVFNCGVYDLRTVFVCKRIIFNLGDALLKDFIDAGRKDFENYEYADYISPVDHITKDFPPCFITYAKKDVFCAGQGELLEAVLTKKGVFYEAYHSKKLKNNHCFPLNTRGKETKENEVLTLDFLSRFCNRTEIANWKESGIHDFGREHKSVETLEKRAMRRSRRAEKRKNKAIEKLEEMDKCKIENRLK